MRVFYLDPGLRSRSGHHPVHCRLIVEELASRGFETRVYGHVDIEADLAAELRAQPHFRHSTYVETDGDPMCGWLTGFDRFSRVTFEDLERLGEISATDLIYLSSTRAIELAAISGWMGRRTPETMPSVVVDFCVPPGSELGRAGTTIKITAPDPRRDARAVLLRFAARRMASHILPRLRLITF